MLLSACQFAGLYDKWIDGGGEEMFSVSILTTDVSPELKWLHTRMPVSQLSRSDICGGRRVYSEGSLLQVILSDKGVARWLSTEKFEDLTDLLTAYRGEDLCSHPVDKKGKSIDLARGISVTCILILGASMRSQWDQPSFKAKTARRKLISRSQVGIEASLAAIGTLLLWNLTHGGDACRQHQVIFRCQV